MFCIILTLHGEELMSVILWCVSRSEALYFENESKFAMMAFALSPLPLSLRTRFAATF